MCYGESSNTGGLIYKVVHGFMLISHDKLIKYNRKSRLYASCNAQMDLNLNAHQVRSILSDIGMAWLPHVFLTGDDQHRN